MKIIVIILLLSTSCSFGQSLTFDNSDYQNFEIENNPISQFIDTIQFPLILKKEFDLNGLEGFQMFKIKDSLELKLLTLDIVNFDIQLLLSKSDNKKDSLNFLDFYIIGKSIIRFDEKLISYSILSMPTNNTIDKSSKIFILNSVKGNLTSVFKVAEFISEGIYFSRTSTVVRTNPKGLFYLIKDEFDALENQTKRIYSEGEVRLSMNGILQIE